MDLAQYELMRAHILDMIDEEAAADGSITLRDVVHAAQERYATHPLFPGGRTRNYCTFTKVDLEARCEIERVPRSSPQRHPARAATCCTHGREGASRPGAPAPPATRRGWCGAKVVGAGVGPTAFVSGGEHAPSAWRAAVTVDT